MRPGRACATTMIPGAAMAPGTGCSRPCGSRTGTRRDGHHSPRRRSWTAKPSRRPKSAGHAAMMGGKKILGRKRQLLVDTRGNLLRVRVVPADLSDQAGAQVLLRRLTEEYPHLEVIIVDQGYSGDAL